MKLLNSTLRNILIFAVLIILTVTMIWLVRGQAQSPLTAQSASDTPTPPFQTLTPTPGPPHTATPTETSPPTRTPTPTWTRPPNSVASTPEPGLTYTPTPVEVKATVEPPAVKVMSDEPLLSPEVLSLVSPEESRSVWVEDWPSKDELLLRVGYAPDTTLWTLSRKQSQTQQNSSFATLSKEQVEMQQVADKLTVEASKTQQKVQETVHSFSNKKVDYGSFSPDGKWIAWGQRQSIEYETLQIKHLNTDEPPITLLGTKKYERYYGHLWSPDSTKIVYIVDKGDVHSFEARISDLTGRQIGVIPFLDGDIAWSPDGQYLAFEMTEEPQSGIVDIFLVRQDGTGLTKLTDHGFAEGHIHWSPTSNAIIYAYEPDSRNSTPWLITVTK